MIRSAYHELLTLFMFNFFNVLFFSPLQIMFTSGLNAAMGFIFGGWGGEGFKCFNSTLLH